MSRELVGTYDLLDRASGHFVECHLYNQIDAHNSADFVNQWKPIFDAKMNELKAAGRFTDEASKEFSLQDAHWLWPEKAAVASAPGPLHGFALECQSKTQGLMIAAPFGFAKEESQRGRPITQVLLISTAPWNRPQLVQSPTYKGVGRILLSAAISLSIEEEHGGRIGLHALSGAEEWYRDACGMTDLGFEAEKNMHYFEMTEAQALRFIS